MFTLTIPRPVENIIGKLNSSGYEAYAVGGCVRDALMGREPEDWDITTSASPWQVKALFNRTVDTGIKHGTVTIIMKGRGYEITTYRIDGAYEDSRHPKEVTFTSDLLEDLKRRDFTINAMAYSPTEGLVDEFGGVDDLDKKIIRCVGDAKERFGEDALRMLRAIRFSAQLDFSIDPATYEAIVNLAPNIANISKERIQTELTKLLLSDHPEKMREVYETGIADYVSPGFAGTLEQVLEEDSFQEHGCDKTDKTNCNLTGETNCGQIGETCRDQTDGSDTGDPCERNDIFAQIAVLPRLKYLRWAAFLRCAGPAKAESILKDLKLDNETIANVKTLITWSGREVAEDASSVRAAMSSLKPELWDALILFSGYSEKIQELTQQIREHGDCLTLKDLAVTGEDLKAAGIKPGRKMGEILNGMLEEVLKDPSLNNKEYLLSTLPNLK